MRLRKKCSVFLSYKRHVASFYSAGEKNAIRILDPLRESITLSSPMRGMTWAFAHFADVLQER